MYLFVVGTNDQLYMAMSGDNGATWYTVNQITGTGSHTSLYWRALGGVCASGPAVTSVVPNTPPVYVFLRGGNGICYIRVGGPVTPLWTGPILEP